MTDAQLLRRESDRAEQRAQRAAKLGDVTAYVIATGQAEAARRRRQEWRPSRDDGQRQTAVR